MTITKVAVDRKIDNIQHQLDIMRRESEAFRAHANSHFEFVSNEVATKEDLYNLERRLRDEMATKDDLYNLENRLEMNIEELETRVMQILLKIAKKVGVSV